MPKFKKVSADEAMSKRKDQTRETGRGTAVIKASKGKNSYSKDSRSARFIMTTEQVDRYGDIVVTDGIDTTEFEKNPVAPLMHNTKSWPVGSWGNLEKILKGRPPRMEGDLILLPAGGPVKEIDEIEWMLANGGIGACSIGFVPNWDEVEMILDDDGKPTWGYKFNASELVECSPCVVPANAGALLKARDGDMRLAKELVEDVLDNWTRSPEGLLLPRADFEAAYKTTVEKIAADKAASTPTVVNEITISIPDGADPEEMAAKMKAFMAKAEETAEDMDPDMDPEDEPMHEDEEAKGLPADDVVAAKAAAEPENKPGTKIKSSPITITLNVDDGPAKQKIEGLTGLLTKLADKFPAFFPKAAPEIERIEPVIVPAAAPVAAPDPVAASKALETAVLLRARLATKGRLAA